MKGEGISLAVLDRRGMIRLLSFDQYGALVLARRRDMISAIESDRQALESLAVLEDRYHRVRIPQDRRVTLSKQLITHLEIQAGTVLYVERFLDEVRLFSPLARWHRIAAPHEQLADLP